MRVSCGQSPSSWRQKMNKQFTQVKHERAKIDGKGLILGRPAYTDDLAPKDALVVRLVRSTHAFAKIKKIDTSKALELPGVECVFLTRMYLEYRLPEQVRATRNPALRTNFC